MCAHGLLRLLGEASDQGKEFKLSPQTANTPTPRWRSVAGCCPCCWIAAWVFSVNPHHVFSMNKNPSKNSWDVRKLSSMACSIFFSITLHRSSWDILPSSQAVTQRSSARARSLGPAVPPTVQPTVPGMNFGHSLRDKESWRVTTVTNLQIVGWLQNDESLGIM